MRPLRLDMHGFTVFREPTTVDLTDADYFALVGPTGSGKSTVLDAICFALYGTVPRWGDRRRIDNALAPSVNEARVRLVFEAAGSRFVATRVVRRDGKGKVTTTHAGLEQLPPSYDLSAFDTAPAQREELGTVLAGTPTEMDAAVAEAVGLPYEQFTSCVVLPQGEFARFLHAKPAHRQEILVNLLGLHVYQRIGERAGIAQREAETKAAATRSLLGDISGADDSSLADAADARDRARGLVADVAEVLPALTRAIGAGEKARVDLERVERELATLAAVRVPDGVASLGEAAFAAREAADQADQAVLAAEEAEEKARVELAESGDKTGLARLSDAYAERVRLATRAAELEAVVVKARARHDKMATAAAAARAKADRAAAGLADARHGVEAAQTADRAASLRVHLVAGEACPVCEQPVDVIPTTPAPALTAARAALAKAEKAAEAALRGVEQQDAALREVDRGLAAASAQHDEAGHRLATVDEALASAPALEAVEAGLAAITVAERAVAAAAEQVRVARHVARGAASAARAAEERIHRAWRDFDRVRDALGHLGPPSADRDDLVASWKALHTWADSARDERGAARDSIVEVAEAALASMAGEVARLERLFALNGFDGPRTAGLDTDPPGYRQAAALAVERANAAYDRVVERREQAARLTEQIARHDREAQVAKSLALHLRADRFERWLLTEALDSLVLGASRILRDLSGGQYDLAHDKGEFAIIDHTDAGLRRGVRTLSGGETFQASLALALALSEQLAGMSTGSASLESIMLDEGFGTLDATTLETVAATLENLAARGERMVGVVTHVPALAERIPVRFEVSRDSAGNAHVRRAE